MTTKLKPADHVKHPPSGETWVVLWADNERGEMMAAGWPHSYNKISEVELVRSATEEQSAEMIESVRNGDHPYRDKVLRLHDREPSGEPSP